MQPNTFLTLVLDGGEGTAVRGKAPVPISQATGLVEKPVWALGRKEKKYFLSEEWNPDSSILQRLV